MTQPVKDCQKTQNSQKTLENKQKSLLVFQKSTFREILIWNTKLKKHLEIKMSWCMFRDTVEKEM